MLSKIRTVALNGMQGMEIEIQTDLSPGLPYFEITGMGDTAVREAAGRVKRAIANSGFEYPRHKITVNLAPAYVKKSGSHFDLGIAVGLLKASGALKGKTDDTIFIGELSFDGKVLPARGVLPMITAVSAVLGIAGALMLAILGGGAFWYLKQRKKKESKPQPSYDEYEDDEDDETRDDDLNE